MADAELEAIEAKVVGVVAQQLGVDENEVKGGSSFIEDLGADSLDIVELVMEMEEQFDLEIPDDKATNLKTVQDVINYVRAHRK